MDNDSFEMCRNIQEYLLEKTGSSLEIEKISYVFNKYNLMYGQELNKEEMYGAVINECKRAIYGMEWEDTKEKRP